MFLLFAASSHSQLLLSLVSSLDFSSLFLLGFLRPKMLYDQSCSLRNCCYWCWCFRCSQGFHVRSRKYQCLHFCARYEVGWLVGPFAWSQCFFWSFQICCWLHANGSMRRHQSDYRWRLHYSWSFVLKFLARRHHYFHLCSGTRLDGGFCTVKAF